MVMTIMMITMAAIAVYGDPLRELRRRLFGRPFHATLAALLAASLLGTTGFLGVGVAAAQLASVGPTSAANGFPQWYTDSNGLSLELCADPRDAMCGFAPGDFPTANAPASFPRNFPVESFYYLATSTMDTNGGGRALLVLALEASFANGAIPRAGDQVVFARYRLRVDNLMAGATYTVTHPYGVDRFVATGPGARGINQTEDVGAATVGNFSAALGGRIGPFLSWDPAVAPAAPAGYLGDPDIPHPASGSPTGTNIFRIEGPNVGGPGVNVIQTHLFTVQGKILLTPAAPPAVPAPPAVVPPTAPAPPRVVSPTNPAPPTAVPPEAPAPPVVAPTAPGQDDPAYDLEEPESHLERESSAERGSRAERESSAERQPNAERKSHNRREWRAQHPPRANSSGAASRSTSRASESDDDGDDQGVLAPGVSWPASDTQPGRGREEANRHRKSAFWAA